jgi:hypothetical protein
MQGEMGNLRKSLINNNVTDEGVGKFICNNLLRRKSLINNNLVTVTGVTDGFHFSPLFRGVPRPHFYHHITTDLLHLLLVTIGRIINNLRCYRFVTLDFVKHLSVTNGVVESWQM